MSVDGRRIAILGGGKIGESLLSGLLSSGWRKPEEIVVSGRRQERIDELAERYDVETTLLNADAVSAAGFIVIAVKPQDFDVLLGEVGGLLTAEQTVLSVAAAMPTAQIERHLSDGVPVWSHVAGLVAEWGADIIGERGMSSVGAVVGATVPRLIGDARRAMPQQIILLPGVGAQGATPADVARAFTSGPASGLVNASRSVIFAYRDTDAGWRDAAGAEAARLSAEFLSMIRRPP